MSGQQDGGKVDDGTLMGGEKKENTRGGMISKLCARRALLQSHDL
jgi:hypothetical protein